MLKTYNDKQKLKKFQRCFTERWLKLRQSHIEQRDRKILESFKPVRRCVDSDYDNGTYVQCGVEFKNEVHKLKVY